MRDPNDPCIFCDDPRRVVRRNALAYCARDSSPVSRGHSLVIPRRHCASFFDLSAEEIAACVELLVEERAGKGTYSDWLFLAILLLTTLTGFLCQALRLADLPRLAYPMYVVHLVLIFFLLVYIPYSKFAHLVYRTAAMLYAASRAPATEAR